MCVHAYIHTHRPIAIRKVHVLEPKQQLLTWLMTNQIDTIVVSFAVQQKQTNMFSYFQIDMNYYIIEGTYFCNKE